MKREKLYDPDRIGFKKLFSWQLRGVSVGCVFVVLSYLTIYCTDTLMMPAALVGSLLFAAKILGSVTDIIAGLLIEKTHTRWGKGRPYEFAVLGLWLSTWLLFSCSGRWSMAAKSIWVFSMYTFAHSIFYTIATANQTPYMIRAFGTQNQIVKLNSYGGVIVTVGCAIVSMAFPSLMAALATSAKGWSAMIGILALPLALIGTLRFFFVKETLAVADHCEKINFREVLYLLKHNRYVYTILLLTLLFNMTQGINVSSFYFTYIVGDIKKYTYIAMLSVPMMLVMFLFPILMKKYTVSNIMAFGGVIGVAGGLLNFIAGDSMPLLILGAACVSFAGLPIAYLMTLMILDCAQYNEKNGRPRMDALVSALQGVGGKIGQGIGAGILGCVMTWSAYNGAAKVQSAAAMTAVRVCYSLVPALLFFLIILIARSYKLDKELKKA